MPRERSALRSWLLDEGRRLLDERFQPDGYNIGINIGEAAGQTILHLHVHLIPRHRGDLRRPARRRARCDPERQHYPT
jgi:diadenosine tetraphosphate (Ap4A) HIT family hydrolase